MSLFEEAKRISAPPETIRDVTRNRILEAAHNGRHIVTVYSDETSQKEIDILRKEGFTIKVRTVEECENDTGRPEYYTVTLVDISW